MKKALSVLLALAMLFGLFSFTAVPASAAEAENYCQVFSSELEWFALFYGFRSTYHWSAIYERTLGKLDRADYETFTQVEEGGWESTCYRIPKVLFEETAAKLFVMDKSFEEMVLEADYTNVIIEENAFVFHELGGRGSADGYKVIGYTENGDGYDVYFRYYDGAFSLESEEYYQEAIEYIKSLCGVDTEEEALACVHRDRTGRSFVFPEPAECHLMKVRYDGTNVQIVDGFSVDTVPADMVTPEPLPKVMYSVSPGITVDGDEAFPENTVVKVYEYSYQTYTQYIAEEKVAEALKETVVDGKASIYEISAIDASYKHIQPSGKVKITFPISDTISTENLVLLYVSDEGKVEVLPVTVDKEAGTATAELTHFSVYALANVDTSLVPKPAEDEIAPPTGDSAAPALWLTLTVLSLLGLGVVTRRKAN